MTPLLQRIHDIGVIGWARFMQALNAVAGSLFGMILILNAQYPSLIRDVTNGLPLWAQLGGVALFCLLVHYANRRAKKAA